MNSTSTLTSDASQQKLRLIPILGSIIATPLLSLTDGEKKSSQDSRQDTSTKFKNIVRKFGAENKKVTFSLVDCLKARDPFLESPSNFSGPKSNIQIKI